MRPLRKISENREIEDIIAEELNTLIYRFMITEIKKKEGGAYEPRTLASSLHSQEKNTNVIHRPRFSVGLGRYSRRLAQFLPIRTSRPANSIYILNMFMHSEVCMCVSLKFDITQLFYCLLFVFIEYICTELLVCVLVFSYCETN